MRTEELNKLKEEIEMLDKKFGELTEEELDQVAGGFNFVPMRCDECDYFSVWTECCPNEVFDCPRCGAHAFHC